jgi:hypothetical protein
MTSAEAEEVRENRAFDAKQPKRKDVKAARTQLAQLAGYNRPGRGGGGGHRHCGMEPAAEPPACALFPSGKKKGRPKYTSQQMTVAEAREVRKDRASAAKKLKRKEVKAEKTLLALADARPGGGGGGGGGGERGGGGGGVETAGVSGTSGPAAAPGDDSQASMRRRWLQDAKQARCRIASSINKFQETLKRKRQDLTEEQATVAAVVAVAAAAAEVRHIGKGQVPPRAGGGGGGDMKRKAQHGGGGGGGGEGGGGEGGGAEQALVLRTPEAAAAPESPGGTRWKESSPAEEEIVNPSVKKMYSLNSSVNAADLRQLAKDKKIAKKRERTALVGKTHMSEASTALAALAGGGGTGGGADGDAKGKVDAQEQREDKAEARRIEAEHRRSTKQHKADPTVRRETERQRPTQRRQTGTAVGWCRLTQRSPS